MIWFGVCVCKNCSVFQDMAAIAGLEMGEKEEVPIRSSSVWEVAVWTIFVSKLYDCHNNQFYQFCLHSLFPYMQHLWKWTSWMLQSFIKSGVFHQVEGGSVLARVRNKMIQFLS